MCLCKLWPARGLSEQTARHKELQTSSCSLIQTYGTAAECSFPETCSFRNMLVLGKASSLLCFLFLQKSFCHGQLCLFLVLPMAAPCLCLVLLLPRRVFAPRKAKSSGFVLVLLPTLAVSWVCPAGATGHLLPSCLGGLSAASAWPQSSDSRRGLQPVSFPSLLLLQGWRALS